MENEQEIREKIGEILDMMMAEIFVSGKPMTKSEVTNAIVDLFKSQLTRLQSPKLWYAVDENGAEYSFRYRPERFKSIARFGGCWYCNTDDRGTPLEPGTIKAITGRDMTWNDEPKQL